MHRLVIVCIMLALMAQVTGAKGETTPCGTASGSDTDYTITPCNVQNNEEFNMVVIGDSIAWGAGLNRDEKYSYLVAKWLSEQLSSPVNVRVLAHTGATLEKKTADIEHQYPDIPSSNPTLFEQVDKISNPDYVDLVLVSGGANDVDLKKLNSLDYGFIGSTLDEIQTASWDKIETPMFELLKKMLDKCPNAKIVVTGYYSAISKDSKGLTEFYKAFAPESQFPFSDYKRADDPTQLYELATKADIFYVKSNLALNSAKIRANKESGQNRIEFARIVFPSDRSYGTDNSWLWKIEGTEGNYKTDDHKYDVRDSLAGTACQQMGLRRVCDKPTNAKIVVTGYYSAISKDSKGLTEFYKAFAPESQFPFSDYKRADDPTQLYELATKADIFYVKSNLALNSAKIRANKESGQNRIEFARIVFPSDRSYGTDNSWLWKIEGTEGNYKTDDHKYDVRDSLAGTACQQMGLRRVCDKPTESRLAALGHPNVEGAGEYNRAIVQKISETWPDWLTRAETHPGSQIEKKDFGGVEFPYGIISFADRIVSYNPCKGVKSPYDNPSNALGPPDYNGDASATYVSLGNAKNTYDCGSLIIEFTDNSLVDVPGDDLYIFEVGGRVEASEVFISEDGQEWIDISRIKGSTRGIDIHDKVSPGQEFYFVKLCDYPDGDTSSSPTPGPDIDAVGAIGSLIEQPLTNSPETNSEDIPSSENALITGTWRYNYYHQGKIWLHEMVIDTFNQETGSFRGHGWSLEDPTIKWDISGTVDKINIEFNIDYTGNNPNYWVNAEGVISSASFMNGTAEATNGAATWDAIKIAG